MRFRRKAIRCGRRPGKPFRAASDEGISVAAPVILDCLNQWNEKKEACQQKDDTPCEHQRLPVDYACRNEEKGADNKENPAIQLIAHSFISTSFRVVFFHSGFSARPETAFLAASASVFRGTGQPDNSAMDIKYEALSGGQGNSHPPVEFHYQLRCAAPRHIFID